MQGLRKQETEKFQRFFALIQAEAEKHDAVFFADAGDGHEFETATMEGENMMGWLIPTDRVREFEPIWQASAVNDDWTEFFMWAIWNQDGNRVVIRFEE